MGNRKISSDLKECAVIYRWETVFAEFGTVNRPPSPICGQELRILTRALMTACEELFAKESDLYLDELATWLALTHDISISIPTLSRNLKEAGLTRKLLQFQTSTADERL
ncbi:hypothetical protein AZE42_13695 [Rhizopogon vesiculosus]|uniref:Winged helix-turn helix domain-containing protein n=1 Tax=Rhizopogon vesiculosus TaxID=180088 RepID=A0A1J8Q412_9AGAM|nr:hypothetical protein AZE42_13695 [Rhizopogon vesiculosus]